MVPSALGTVVVRLPPGPITISRQAQTSYGHRRAPTAAGRGGASASIFQGSAGSTIQIRNALLTGLTTKPRVDTMLDWMSPGGGMLGALIGGAISAVTGGKVNLLSALPVVTFSYGPPEMASST